MMARETPTNGATRPPYRPPDGLPVERQGRWGVPVAVLLHVLVLLLLLVPAVATGVIPTPLTTGAGGAGPAGGGGGGTGGLGLESLVPERLRFLHVTPPAPQPAEQPTITPPAVPPPEIKEPETPKTPEPERTSVVAEPTATVSSTGEGGGTGDDGSSGNGPGRGGGVGSGEGPGRGSGIGPGTGGGTDDIYPPSPTQMFLPPLPTPNKVKGHTLVAVIEVDSTGQVLDISFNKTRDGEYNEKIEHVLHELRFRPATRADGTPVRAKVEITYTL